MGDENMKRQITVNLGRLLLALSEVTDLANPSLIMHQHRTAFIALEMARNANLAPEVVENIFAASLLHDIGAISVEEKVALHNFENLNTSIHTIRGEVLLEQVPWLKSLSRIVRNHHREWHEWDESIDDALVMSSQIVLLADYVERLIDRNKYILHQREDIVQKIKELEGTVVNKKVVEYFIDVSKREEFWLDLMSPGLLKLLQDTGPLRNEDIGLDGISLIARFYRDIIDFKSPFTATHTSGVSACAEKLSQLFGLTELEVSLMSIAGNFHDVGKLVIPNSILEKPGKLSAEEYAIIKSHTYYTYYILNSIGGMEQIARWAAYHHEKLDGSGYPFHCSADEIDTGSRIMAVADIFTAVSEDRPYRNGMGRNEIYKVIKKQADLKLLDKNIVELLFDNYEVIDSSVRERQALSQDFYERRFLSIAERCHSDLA